MQSPRQPAISARGYTNVILVLNMRRFVHREDKEYFEFIRGTTAFTDILSKQWPERSNHTDTFTSLHGFEQQISADMALKDDAMSPDQVGFATGVFRSLMLERYALPTYVLNKEQVEFGDALCSNFQFKTLFQRAWNRWEIYIRPTMTGFFVIRLTQRYQKTTRPLLDLARDVLRLQESLDVASAQQWMTRNRERYQNDPETLTVKEKSIQALLGWMGAGDEEYQGLLYYPVQWKLAMEVIGLFVKMVHDVSFSDGKPPVRFYVPEPSLSIPLHDSYVIHHFDELLASQRIIQRTRKSHAKENVQIPVTLNDIRKTPNLRRALVNLMEGTVLREKTTPPKWYFPDPRWSITDALLDDNLSSWNDELCIFSARTAIIMPSRRWREHEMAISTVPSATLRVRYARYWDAIERMAEFVLEIRVLAQLLESTSYDLLVEIAGKVHQTRAKLFSGDIIMEKGLPSLVTRAAHLRRLSSMTQSISHPQLWSRAEYAIQKADYLLKQLGVPITLANIERNIDNINSVVDHIDELYLADLSEQNNNSTTLLSLGLAAASLILTWLIMPSFWSDLGVIFPDGVRDIRTIFGKIYWGFGGLGTFLGIVLIGFAGYLVFVAWKQRKRVQEIFDKYMQRSG